MSWSRKHQRHINSQVLLHDPAEVPQMKDLGYAISPGSHTLLATKYTKVSHLVSLPTFYGLPNILILRFLKKSKRKISTFKDFEDLSVSWYIVT